MLQPPDISLANDTTKIARHCKGNLVQHVFGAVVQLELRAVIGVNTRASRKSGVVLAKAVVVPYEVQVRLWTPQNLAT